MLARISHRRREWIALILALAACWPALAQGPAPAPSSPSVPASPPAADSPVRAAVSFGTGFSIGNGYVLTAQHVVRDATRVMVGQGGRGQWVPSEVVKTDALLDLALIRTPLALPAARLARSDNVPVGLEIFVIGYPQPSVHGLSPKITQGLINGYPRRPPQAQDTGYFQISAEVSRGNSGGPLVGPDGSVIGMIQRKLDTQRILDRTQEWMVNVSYALRSSHIVTFLAGTEAAVVVEMLDLQQTLRPHLVYERVNPSIVSIIVPPPARRPATSSATP